MGVGAASRITLEAGRQARLLDWHGELSTRIGIAQPLALLGFAVPLRWTCALSLPYSALQYIFHFSSRVLSDCPGVYKFCLEYFIHQSSRTSSSLKTSIVTGYVLFDSIAARFQNTRRYPMKPCPQNSSQALLSA